MYESPEPRPTDPAERFFYDNAGFSYRPESESAHDGKVRAAVALARAERIAQRRGWRVETADDPDGPMPDDVGSVETVAAGDAVCLVVYLTDDEGDVLASLWNVIVPSDDDPYNRVVGAELADEVITEREPWMRDATTRHDDDGAPIVSWAECGHCGYVWDDAVTTSHTPAPAGRCPMEGEHVPDEIVLSYRGAEVDRVINAGPAAGETWFRLTITGAETTRTLNIDGGEAFAIRELLN